jgi:peptidoglycan/xylan/chitin deacetylase (PgdA/CDA1 family)
MLSRIEPRNSAKTAPKTTRRNILCFHKLTDCFTYGSTNFSPKRFAQLIEYLANTGFKFVSLSESITADDQANLAITIDDSYAHLIHTLPPLIEKYRLKPTIFVPTSFIGMKNIWDYSSIIRPEPHLDKTQITELGAMGVAFGSHGHRHIDLTRCGTETLDEELHQSKSILEEITGRAVDTLSYPFGRFNFEIVKAVQNAGYQSALTLRFPDESDLNHTRGRIPVYFFDYSAFIKQKLIGGRMRIVHQKLNRFINVLSRGTTILNQLIGRNRN